MPVPSTLDFATQKVLIRNAQNRKAIVWLTATTALYQAVTCVIQYSAGQTDMSALTGFGALLALVIGGVGARRSWDLQKIGLRILPSSLLWLAASVWLDREAKAMAYWNSSTTEVMLVMLSVALLERQAALVFTLIAFGAFVAVDFAGHLQVLSAQQLVDIAYLNALPHVLASHGFLQVQSRRDVARLQEQVLIDPLTGLYNRQLVYRLRDKWGNGELGGQELFALVLLDVDHFKRINDVHGHAVGDQVLQFVAGALGDSLRPDELAIRWGGEEFLIIYRRVTPYQAHERVVRLVQQIANTRAPGEINVTVSAGLSFSEEDLNVIMLMTLADQRLYDAKNAGRNQVVAGPASEYSCPDATVLCA